MIENTRENKVISWGMVFILLIYLLYAGTFIYQSSFVYNGTRYFTLFDDTAISLQYARNLANGYGPVWNSGGEHTEGFSNPLWVAYMSIFHLLHIPSPTIGLCFQISGAFFVILTLILVKNIAAFVSKNDPRVVLISVFLTAFYYPISNWSLLGTEVSILLFLSICAVWLTIKTIESGNFSFTLYSILAVSLLVRFDMAVLYIFLWVFLLWFDKSNRKIHFLFGGILFIFIMGGQTLLRIWYYGAPLPNTYYLKMTGISLWLRLYRGLYVFAKFIWNLGLIYFVVPFLIFAFKRDRYTLLLILAFLVPCAYSIYIGGDAWEHRGGSNRFITLGMPFFLILFAQTSVHIFKLLKKHGLQEFSGKFVRFVKPVNSLFLLIFIFFGLINFNTLLDGNSLKYWLLLEQPVFSYGSQRYTVDGLLVKDLTAPEAKILVNAAGNVTYFSERYSYDLMGKSDAVIARQEVNIPDDLESIVFLQPGHYKYDYSISIGEYQPDVLVELKEFTDEDFLPWLDGYEKYLVNNHAMYFRTDSNNVLWDKVENYKKLKITSEENSCKYDN